jgi:hypothetical protein
MWIWLLMFLGFVLLAAYIGALLYVIEASHRP